MSPSIGSLFGGRPPRESTRPRRRAPFRLEALEPRLLMAGTVASTRSSGLVLPPAQVLASRPVVPVTLHLPEGDATWPAFVWSSTASEQVGALRPGADLDVFRIPAGRENTSLWLDLSWEKLPEGSSCRLLIFDAEGRLHFDQSVDSWSQSMTVGIDGSWAKANGPLSLGIQIREPAGSSPIGGEFSYRLRLTTNAGPISGGWEEAPGSPSDSDDLVFGPGTGIGGSGITESAQGAQPPMGGVTSGPGASHPESPSAPSGITTLPGNIKGASSPIVLTQGPGGLGSSGASAGGGDSASSGSLPAESRALPSSGHQAAGGILADGRAAENVDRHAEMRVDLSLARLLSPSPGPKGRRTEIAESDLDRVASASTFLAADPDSDLGPPSEIAFPVGSTSGKKTQPSRPGGPMVLAATTGRTGLDAGPGTHRTEGRPGVVRISLTTGDAGETAGWSESAAGAPTDRPGPGRPSADGRFIPEDDIAGDEEPPSSPSSRGPVVVLGLGGSAALGVCLYAPDLAAAVRRTRPRSPQGPRSQAASRRGDRGPE